MKFRSARFWIAATAVMGTAACSSKKGVTPPPPPPASKITVSAASVTVTDTIGKPVTPVTLSITAGTTAKLKGLTIGAIAFDSASNGRTWLAASLSSDSAPANLVLSISDSGMAAGTYTATVPIAATAASNSPVNLPVTLMLVSGHEPPPPPPTGSVVLAVGNARCTGANIAAIQAIVEANPNATLLNLGDMTYTPNGGAYADFQNCYNPHLGTAFDRTFAVLGSWEQNDSAWAPGADAYFGPARVGPPGRNMYTINIGNWRVIMLNVVNGSKRTYGNNSFQLDFLDTALVHDSAFCTLAVWHDPMFYSSATQPTGSYPNENPNQSGLWRELYKYNADVVLNGGYHTYERIGPMRWDQAQHWVADSARGLMQFNSGLGGDGSFDATFKHPLSDYVSGGVGVLKLTLGDSSYAWEFINAPGSTVTDSGVGKCH